MPNGIEIATAYVSIVTESSRVAPEVKKSFGVVGKEADRAGRTSGKRFAGAFGTGLKLLGGAALGGGVISFLKSSNDEAREAQKVGALTANVIKSTGKAANISANQVGNLSTAISNKVGIDDEAIQSGANLLLTFKNVRNEVGKGNKIFNRATQAAVDLSAAGFGDLNGASKQLGKALNDPVKGITALSRSGVTFTDQQKEQIKTFVKSGKTLQAQKIILKEVESQVGGAAAAQATAGDKAAVAIGNLKEQIGTALLPVVDKLATFTSNKVVPAISKFAREIQDGTGAGGRFADKVKEVVAVGKGVLSFFNGLPGPVKKFGVELAIAGLVMSKTKTLLGPTVQALSGFATGMKNAETRSTKLASASKSLAGVGGLLAVADAAHRTNPALAGLEGALGGAAAGFALGGPIGALIGGAGGGLLGVFSSAKKAAAGIDAISAAAAAARPQVTSYADSLSGLNAAQTKATRNIAIKNLQDNKKFFEGTGLGERVLLSAILGRKKALDTVTRTLNNQRTALVAQKDAAQAQVNLSSQYFNKQQQIGTWSEKERSAAFDKVQADKALLNGVSQRLTQVDALRSGQDKVIGGLRQQQAEQRHVNALGLSYRDLLNMGIAPAVAKAFDSKTGVGPYAADVANLIAKFHIIDQTKWKPILQAAGLKPTRAVIEQIQGMLKDIARTRRPGIDSSGIDSAQRKANLLLNTLTGLNKRAAGGADGDPLTPRRLGGPVRRGQSYLVGESQPELFVPNQSGRILPRVPAAIGTAVGGSGGGSGHTILRVGDRDFVAYLEQVAQSRVDAASAMQGETERAFG